MVASQGSGLECIQNIKNPVAFEDTEVAMLEAVNESVLFNTLELLQASETYSGSRVANEAIHSN
jgi:hypothetical protein